MTHRWHRWGTWHCVWHVVFGACWMYPPHVYRPILGWIHVRVWCWRRRRLGRMRRWWRVHIFEVLVARRKLLSGDAWAECCVVKRRRWSRRRYRWPWRCSLVKSCVSWVLWVCVQIMCARKAFTPNTTDKLGLRQHWLLVAGRRWTRMMDSNGRIRHLRSVFGHRRRQCGGKDEKSDS